MTYTIDIETHEGAATAEEVVDRVAEELQVRTVDPSVSINTRSGIVAATFQVEAATMQEAFDLAVHLYSRALDAAGIDAPGGVIKGTDEMGSVTVASVPARELVGV